MLPLLAWQFALGTPDTLATAVPAARTRLLRSVSDALSDALSFTIELRDRPFRESPGDGHTVTLTEETAADATLWRLTWTRPLRRGGRLLATVAELARAGPAASLSLEMALGITAQDPGALGPLERIAEPPAVLERLVSDGLLAQPTGRPLRPFARTVGASDVDYFFQHDLTHPARALPLVLLSGRHPAAEPDPLAARLLGLAEVFHLESEEAELALLRLTGRLEACHSGAVRIYPPRWAPQRRMYVPALLPAEAKALGLKPGGLAAEIFTRLGAQAALRFERPEPARLAVAALERKAQEERDAVRARARAAGEYEELLALADQDVAALKAEKERLEGRVRELEAALAAAEEVASRAKEERPEGLVGVVEGAAQEYADALVFLESAFESAEKSPYRQLDRAREALRALGDVARARRTAMKEKRSIGALRDRFKERGVEYKAQQSMTTKGLYGEEYEVLYEGRKVMAEHHLALGSGGPESCLRVHFFFDDGKGVAVVAHVGRHGTNTRT